MKNITLHKQATHELRKNWLSVMLGALLSMAQRTYLESFEMRCWWRMEKIKWSEEVTNEQLLERIGEKGSFLNNILHRKGNFISHILRINCSFMMSLKDR